MHRKRARDGLSKTAVVNSQPPIQVKVYHRLPTLINKRQTNSGKKQLLQSNNQFKKTRLKTKLTNKKQNKVHQLLMDPVKVTQFWTQMKSISPIQEAAFLGQTLFLTSMSRTFSDHPTSETAERYLCQIVQIVRRKKTSPKMIPHPITRVKSVRTKIQTKSRSSQCRWKSKHFLR